MLLNGPVWGQLTTLNWSCSSPQGAEFMGGGLHGAQRRCADLGRKYLWGCCTSKAFLVLLGGWLLPCNSALSVGYTRCCASVPAAGNAFCQAAKLHMQLQSKHDSATSFVDAGNAYKKADPQGTGDKIRDCFVQIFLAV